MVAAKLFMRCCSGPRRAALGPRCEIRGPRSEVRWSEPILRSRRWRAVDAIQGSDDGWFHWPEEDAGKDAHQDGGRNGRNHERPLAR